MVADKSAIQKLMKDRELITENAIAARESRQYVAPLGHIILILRQSVFLLNAACLAEKQQIPIL
jgi:hypothetical protein